MFRIVASVIILTITLASCNAAVTQIADDKVREFVNEVVKCYNITGLGLAMVTKNQTVFAGGFGVKTLESKDPVTSSTLFNVGSVSKSFTATIAAEAVSRGKIDWDSPLKETFGKEFESTDYFRTEKATLRDALGHKMCVPQYWGATTIAENITRQEMIKRLPYYATICDLRTEYRYSNQMVVAAAAAVEIATCKYWEDAIFDKIYNPLGMRGSRIGSKMTDEDWKNTAISYTSFNGQPRPNPEKEQAVMLDYMGPAAGVYSNAEDMAKYLRFHINKGKDENGVQVVPEKELEETHRPNFATVRYTPDTGDVFPVLSTIDTYGMGWRTGYYRGLRKVEHTGSYSGYTCRNTFLPDAEVGVWLCEASGSDGYTANQVVSWYALDLLLGKQPWLNTTTACSFPSPWIPPPPSPSSPPPVSTTPSSTAYPQPSCAVNFTHYTGNYNHQAFGTFRVYIDENQELACSSGQLLNCTLTPLDCDGHFKLTVKGVLSYRDPDNIGWRVDFRRPNSTTKFDRVLLPYMDGSTPPVFHRGDNYKPTDYPAGRGPLSAICKKPKRREVRTVPTPISGASTFRSFCYFLVSIVIYFILE